MEKSSNLRLVTLIKIEYCIMFVLFKENNENLMNE